jgi:hypothetical protein
MTRQLCSDSIEQSEEFDKGSLICPGSKLAQPQAFTSRSRRQLWCLEMGHYRNTLCQGCGCRVFLLKQIAL